MNDRYPFHAYKDLDPHGRPRRLFNWLVRYHAQHGGRRASRSEMRNALSLHRDQLASVLLTLEDADLFEIERDAQGQARSYRLPGERYDHPLLATLAADEAFHVGSTIEMIP